MRESPLDNFSWVIPGKLAAAGRLLDSCKALEFLKDEGLDVIISLTERRLNEAMISEFGFEYHHLPVEDFRAPEPGQIEEFVRIVDDAVGRGRTTVVHCLAGRGRTGTMLSCYLVRLGRTAGDAMEEVRRLRPGSVETLEQQGAVREYERRYKVGDH